MKGGRGSGRPLVDEVAGAVAWRGAVQLGGSVVFCDAGRARDLVFLSHAHLRPRAAHGKLVASPRTLALWQARGQSPEAVALPVPFGRPLSLGAVRLELYPSGHVPGAASLLLLEPSGRRIAYAGDVNPRAIRGEPGEVRGADALVLDAKLAPLGGRLPPRAEAHGRLVEAVRAALRAGVTPVVLVPPLGVGQEAQAVLAAAGVAVSAHPAVRAWSRAVARVGAGADLGELPAARLPTGAAAPSGAVLWPLELGDSQVLRRAPRTRLIALTGQALDPRFAARARVELAIALSDHADLPDLCEYVAQTGARAVWATSGFGPALVEALGRQGVAVRPLGPPRQMELGLA